MMDGQTPIHGVKVALYGFMMLSNAVWIQPTVQMHFGKMQHNGLIMTKMDMETIGIILIGMNLTR